MTPSALRSGDHGFERGNGLNRQRLVGKVTTSQPAQIAIEAPRRRPGVPRRLDACAIESSRHPGGTLGCLGEKDWNSAFGEVCPGGGLTTVRLEPTSIAHDQPTAKRGAKRDIEMECSLPSVFSAIALRQKEGW